MIIGDHVIALDNRDHMWKHGEVIYGNSFCVGVRLDNQEAIEVLHSEIQVEDTEDCPILWENRTKHTVN